MFEAAFVDEFQMPMPSSSAHTYFKSPTATSDPGEKEMLANSTIDRRSRHGVIG
jgi:hypothetical protein